MRHLPAPRLLIVTILVCVGINIPFAYYLVYPNTGINIFRQFLNESHVLAYNKSLNVDQFSTQWSIALSGMPEVGALFGVGAMFLLVDRFGRRGTVIIGLLPLIIGGVIELLAFYLLSYALFVFGQFVIGLSMGVSTSVAGIYLTECAPVEHRGFTATFQELTLDALFALSMAIGLPDVAGKHENRYLLVSVPLILVMFIIVALFFIPESPKHLLLTKHDEAGAAKAIAFFHGSYYKVEDVLEEIQEEALEEQISQWALFKDLCKSFRINVAIGQATELLVPFSGVVGISLFSTEFFLQAGIEPQTAEYASVGLGVLNFAVTLVALPFVERAGRRPLLLASCGGVIVFLFLFVIATQIYSTYKYPWASHLAIAAILGHMIAFSMGTGPIPWFYTSELLPHAHRSMAHALVASVTIVVTCVTSVVILPLFYHIKAYSFLVIYAGPLVVLYAGLCWKMPETKQKTIAQIVMELRPKVPVSATDGELHLLNNLKA